jgi:hypothetical protein
MKIITLIFAVLLLFTNIGTAQDLGRISGNFQIDAQGYTKDSAIGTEDVPDGMRSNSYLLLNWDYGNFKIGMRYENYSNPLLGFEKAYAGSGIAYRFFEYKEDLFDVTAGNFYEQFGSGIIFRSYEERQLGIDNAMDGFRVRFRPSEGIELKALIGKQRNFWGLGDGIVRAADAQFSLGSLVEGIVGEGNDLILGGSVVSKYQTDMQTYLDLPLNVLAYSLRAGFSSEGFNFDAEYAYKFNDPNATNNYNFNPGYGLILNAAIFGSGYGLTINAHKIDNMDFRSSRDARSNSLTLGFIPPLTLQHAFRLTTIYPFATQLNGEAGIQAEFTYTFPANSFLGGEYGTTVNLNYSRVQSIDTTHTEMDTVKNRPFKYDSPFFGIGSRCYFQDITLEISKKFSKDFKSFFSVVSVVYDKDLLENGGAAKIGKVYATTLIAELTYKFSVKNSLRCEFQYMFSTQDSTLHQPDNINGDWAMVLAEYTIAPSWYFTVWDEYNIGNEFVENRLNYLNGAVAYVHNSFRVSLGYGRQRSGVLCVGGVCRTVPASNGPSLSVSATF